MSLDTLSVRIVNETEIDAETADLTVVVEGSSVFSGAEAFKKAKELRTLIEVLKEAGLEESRVKLRSVQLNSQSFAMIKTSSAKYVLAIKAVTVEFLPVVLGALAAHKGAKVSKLKWNYGQLKSARSRLRREALRDALQQAHEDADVLGVNVLGIHRLTENVREVDYNPEYITGDISDFDFRQGVVAGHQDVGLQLGNSTTVKLDLLAEFRVSAMAADHDVQAVDAEAGE